MPGLFGILRTNPQKQELKFFQSYLASLQHTTGLKIETRIAHNNQWAIGRVHLGALQPSPQLSDSKAVQVLLHGDLYNTTAIKALLHQQGCQPSSEDAVSLVASLYHLYGAACAKHLKGAFCVAILDTTSRQLVLINDIVGTYFLYWSKSSEHFVFAPELKALLLEPSLQPTLHPRAIADYITFGFLLGNKTLVEQVQLVPAGSTLTYCWRDNTCDIQGYANASAFFQTWEGTREEYREQVCQAFNHAVQRAVTDIPRCGVSLSGGLDSRAILSAIDCSQTPLTTYTLGVKGCADEVIAQQLSSLAGTCQHFLEMDTRYLGDFLISLKQMVALTDGMYMTHGLTEILALRFLQDAGLSVLLRGHGGELAKTSLAWPLHTDNAMYRMKNKEEFVPYLLSRVNYISGEVALADLFTPGWASALQEGGKLSLEESVADIDLSPADLCSYLYLSEHHRRFTGASLEVFRSAVEVRLPFVDEDFLRVLLRGSSAWRDDTTLHRAIIGTNNLALLKVRNSNTGAPGDAGPLVETLFDKLNSLLKRINFHGYRHYHDFQQWMKQTLLETVRQVLLHPDSLGRGIVQETTLRRMLDVNQQGKADFSYLFQILLILELWQRESL